MNDFGVFRLESFFGDDRLGENPMRNSSRVQSAFCVLLVALAPLMFVTGCRTVPGTGRSQLNLVDEAQLSASAATEFDSIKKTQSANNPAMLASLQRVGKRIVAEAIKVDSTLPPYEQWEFIVVNDAAANAFAMPGGKVAFNTGIFALMNSDDDVAVVMGHEVAHVVGRHGNERVTIAMGLNGIGAIAGVVADQYVKSDAWKSAILTTYGAGSQLGTLKYSRTHESEADVLGLKLSSKAGYNPEVAITFWERMSSGGSSTPEFLSTHPSGTTRITDLRAAMPEALENYRAAQAAGLPAGEKFSFSAAATGATTSSSTTTRASSASKASASATKANASAAGTKSSGAASAAPARRK